MLLKFAIQEFKDDREYKNLSPNTIQSYILTLNEFQSYCVEQEILHVEDVRQSIIKSYLLHCQKNLGNNPTSRNHKLKNIKTFFNYLVDVEIIESKLNPVKGLSFVKEDIQIDTFNDNHIKQMLNYYRRIKDRTRSFQSYRNYCIIVFLLGTGSRLGEVRNLKWNDIDLVNGAIVLYGKKRVQSSIPITDKLVKELSEYKMYCQQYFGELSEFVFVSDQNNQLAVDTIKNIFKKLKQAMGFKDVRLSAHTFRHSFAKRYLMAGGDLFSLQKMLRHSKIDMTQRYVNLFGTELRELNNRHNPLNDLDI